VAGVLLIAIGCGAAEYDSLGLQPEDADEIMIQSSGGATSSLAMTKRRCSAASADGGTVTCGSRHRLSPAAAPQRMQGFWPVYD
jgi:hypothetical protein